MAFVIRAAGYSDSSFVKPSIFGSRPQIKIPIQPLREPPKTVQLADTSEIAMVAAVGIVTKTASVIRIAMR